MQNKKQKTESGRCENYAKYEYNKSSYEQTYDVFQSLRQDGLLCDIKLKADDNKIIIAHKVVLASASPYFYAMFTKFSERNHDLVVIRQIDSTALHLLINFIYSGKIMVTKDNVQILLPAANLLRLEEVTETCCEFLHSQLCPTNCIGIYTIADLHSRTKLLTSSELYIQQHFSEVVGGDEFLSLSSEQMVKFISSDKLIVSSEEKVFECVIRWVKHELGSRKCVLLQLMEHVRLPLTSKNYILKKVVEEPLIKNCYEYYINEAINFHLFNAKLIPRTIRHKPRYGDKVLLDIGGIEPTCTQWYDPKINQWHFGPEIITSRHRACGAVVKNNLVFAVGGMDNGHRVLRSVEVLDLSFESPGWKPSVEMLVERMDFGVGVINNYLYAVGGRNHSHFALDNAEVFDNNTQEWSTICNMSITRSYVGVGVLNNLLYAVGGFNDALLESVDTVECYHPSIDKWIEVAKMCEHRSSAGVGVLDGVLYAVGGFDGNKFLSSVEAYRPSTGIWTPIGDMQFPRQPAGVVALDGLLYVVGGEDECINFNTVECYNPKTNTWTLVASLMNTKKHSRGVVAINRTGFFKAC
ncbi:kelch-like protein 2 isoform X2 [Acyrthosiphon pisum]|uniref:Kelch-like protein diablo n=1 Tax=Acyrthosiphon pisum TaxID=7029 RepID=A0A8R2NV04_ACYPI|nr:kelch-like protein 2 isoform X2 [Acyrthosiphon pisum]